MDSDELFGGIIIILLIIIGVAFVGIIINHPSAETEQVTFTISKKQLDPIVIIPSGQTMVIMPEEYYVYCGNIKFSVSEQDYKKISVNKTYKFNKTSNNLVLI